MSLGCLDQIIQTPLRCVGQSPSFSWAHSNPEADGFAFHFRAFLDALVAGVGVDHGLLTVQEIGCWGEVMHISGRGFHRVDQACVLVDADVDLPLRGPLATCRNAIDCPSWSGASLDPSRPSCSVASGALGRRPRRGGAGRCDQGGIDDCALLHGHALDLEVGFHSLKNLLTEIVLLQQMAERQDRGLIGDALADQVDAGKAPHGGHLDQGILHRWVAE